MTWTKLGSEFFDECANAGLTDAAVRTHVEAIGYLYNIGAYDLVIKKALIRRWAGSPDYWQAITSELVPQRWWQRHDNGTDLIVVHHGEVIRQSLAAQDKKKTRDRRSQQAKRDRDNVSADVSDDVSDGISGDTDRQTDKQAVTDPVTGEVFDDRKWLASGSRGAA